MKGDPLTDEQKARMAEGRRRAARERFEEAARVQESRERAELENAVRIPSIEEIRSGSLLTDAEMEEIRRKAAAKIEAEKADALRSDKQAAMAKVLDDEIRRQRKEAGLSNHMDDLLEICIDVAPFSGNIVLDGQIYEHGKWYTVDRRKYETIREICARSWDAEDRAGNPNRKHYRNVAGTMNPMQNERRGSDGTLTMFPEGSSVNAASGAVFNQSGKGIAG